MRFVKPLDEKMLQSLAQRIKIFITIEDNVIHGGFGSGVLEAFSHLSVSNVAVKMHGLPDEFIEHGSPKELYRMVKLDAAGIAEIAKKHLNTVRNNPMS